MLNIKAQVIIVFVNLQKIWFTKQRHINVFQSVKTEHFERKATYRQLAVSLKHSLQLYALMHITVFGR